MFRASQDFLGVVRWSFHPRTVSLHDGHAPATLHAAL